VECVFGRAAAAVRVAVSALPHQGGCAGPVAGWLSVGMICMACGYATFLGRFLRLNSWDVLQPLRTLERIVQHTDAFALQFSASFGAYILFTYCIFRAFGASHKKTV